MSDENIALFPAWRQAVKDFLVEFRYGDLVSHEWLSSHFGMPALNDGQRLTEGAFKQRQFAWLARIEAFKEELLHQHKVCLQSVHGEGYRWVHPAEQTSIASRDFERDAKKVFRTAGQRLKNIRAHELTEDQRRENSDAIAKLSQLRGTTRQALR